jgi:hypothetical protein
MTEEGLAARKSFVGELVPNVVEEVLALGFGSEELPVLVGGEGEVTVNLAAVESQVESPPRPIIRSGGQELRFKELPVQDLGLSLIPKCAHDPKIVGTISFRG